jgi:hypothetical protein
MSYGAHRTWLAMRKFCNDEPLTEQELDDLSWLSLIDRSRAFEPGNACWATKDAERADNPCVLSVIGTARALKER